MQPANLVILMSDAHRRDALGCYGHPLVKTPHLDRLAERGTRFSNAYCASPICVPSRASIATGRYVHQHQCWDNAHPYHGQFASWGHRLIAQGHRVTAIGKLHYRDSRDANGFDEEILPMHVADGVGDVLGMIRHRPLPRTKHRGLIEAAGPGDTPQLRYDREVTAAATHWLRSEASRYRARPWVLLVSWFCPHFPFVCPPEFFDLYPRDRIELPKLADPQSWPRHPALDDLRQCFNLTEPFDEGAVRRAIAAYLGLCSFIDDNVGQVVNALGDAGLSEDTRVLYLSDHGEALGDRGIWGKSTHYEEAAAVPLVAAGPGVESGAVCATPVSLVDCFPSIIEAVGARAHDDDGALPGRSLWSTATGGDPDRALLGEYHAVGSRGGSFMIRKGRYKYIHHVMYPAQLFDLLNDPNEIEDLAGHQQHRHSLAEMAATLTGLIDPLAIDARAKADQMRKLAEHGRGLLGQKG